MFVVMRRLFLILTVLTVLLTTVGCGPSATDTPAAPADSTALRLGVLPTMECLPFYAAAATGVFDSLGVSVRLLTYEAAMDADTAFQRGHVDAVCTDLVKAVLWRSEGQNVRLAMAADLQLYLVTARQARLKTGASLKEKIVAYTRNSAPDYTADHMLALARLGSQQLNKPQINNIPLRTQMLLNAQYDGALLPEPFASQAMAAGNNLVYQSLNLKQANPLFAVVVGDSVRKARGKEIQQLARAYDAVVERLSRTDSTDAAQWMHYLPLPATWPDSVVVVPQLKPSCKPTDAVVDSVKQWLRGRSLLKNEVKYSDLF